MSDPITVYPPGPFPPHGAEPPGTIDLGVRLRDTIYRRELVEGPVRNAFISRLASSARDPQRLLMALPVVDSLLDTWPLASLIDDARETWTQGPDGKSLAVLARAAHVVSSVLGFPQVIDRRWPMPDVEWMKEQAGPGPHEVVHRGPRDGAYGVGIVLEAESSRQELWDLPTVLTGQGDTLDVDLPDLLAKLKSGEGAAVWFESPHGYDEDSLAALDALAEASPLQRGFQRYGHAGLVAPDAPTFEELLGDAPAGKMSDVLQRTCDVVVLPNLDAEGRITAFGALLWDGPYEPMRVVPIAAQLLGQLDGKTTIAAIAEETDATVEAVREVFAQLVEMGAATAA